MSNGVEKAMTYLEAINAAKAELDRLQALVDAANDAYWERLTEAAHAGASFRELGQIEGVSAATMMRRIGHKRHPGFTTALDMPVRNDGAGVAK